MPIRRNGVGRFSDNSSDTAEPSPPMILCSSTVTTARWYSYVDMTPQAEALFRFIEETIDTELVEELAFLANYDETKRAIQEIVDMPDRQIDLFIRFCMQNNGRLSSCKRASRFDTLSEDEIARMEQAIRMRSSSSNG